MSFWSKRYGWATAVALMAGSWSAQAVSWFPLGPYGGSARSLAADPQDSRHLFLGTATGWIYDSHDGGSSWKRMSHIENRDDLVIDHIVVDVRNPKRLIAGAFAFDHPDGGIFISEDDGKTWYSQAQMRGQSIRSLARSQSNPQELVAGTLSGVFRTQDNGRHWERISSPDNTELHEVESIAIDPSKPDVIYAGTWHLPWKSEDGGATWKNIKQGIIDDSDVFSIIVDPDQPQIVYASACSGIYKSEDGGGSFHKIQGIPSTARRTRKLAQDPANLRTVFAGTTEGLYRTLDAGMTWERMTGPEIVVNDVYVDPSNDQHVLLATDRGGVLRSEDGGVTFVASNPGFSARQVISFAADPHHPSTLYVGVVNDKETGGVFVSEDEGVHWQQKSEGLHGSDVFSLGSTPDGTMLAGTEHGVFRLDGDAWVSSSDRVASPAGGNAAPVRTQKKARPKQLTEFMVPDAAVHMTLASYTSAIDARRKKRPVAVSGRAVARPVAKTPVRSAARASVQKERQSAPVKTRTSHAASDPKTLEAAVYSIAASRDAVFAGTSQGLFVGSADGHGWTRMSTLDLPEVRNITVLPGKTPRQVTMLAAGPKRLELSQDGGESWQTVVPPAEMTLVNALAVDGEGDLWVGGREGVWYSADEGKSWRSLKNLFVNDVDAIYYDAAHHRVLVTAASSSVAFSVSVPDYAVHYWDTGWRLRFVRPAGDHLVGATLHDGMVVEPKMVDTPVSEETVAKRR